MNEELEIIARVRKIIRAVDVYSNKLKDLYGLNSSQLTTLSYIKEQDSNSISDLGNLLNLSPSMLTSIIDQLESRLLVRRVRSDKDRRKIGIELTEMGEQILKNSPLVLHKKLEQNLSKISKKERLNIINSLDTLILSIEAESLDSSPILASGEQIVGEPKMTINIDGEFKLKN